MAKKTRTRTNTRTRTGNRPKAPKPGTQSNEGVVENLDTPERRAPEDPEPEEEEMGQPYDPVAAPMATPIDLDATDAAQLPAAEAPEPKAKLTAYCPHCGRGVQSTNWSRVAEWFGSHIQEHHPDVFNRLFGVASAFLGLMIADQYETDPEWGDQTAVETLEDELHEILEGRRDPFEDGLS